MSGLLAAHRLEQAGIDFVVLEQATEVGGTWLKNQYPGCRVDVSNLFYSYSFEQRTDWPQLFSSQPELLGYFRHFADRAGLRDHIRFSTEVRSATWDDQRLEWRLRLHPLSDLDQDETPDQPESDEEELVVQAIVERGWPAESAAAPEDRWHRALRRSLFPLGRVGLRRRARRKASRRDRHRRERHADRPEHRGTG